MRAALALLLAVAAVRGADPFAVEIAVERATLYVHEPVRVTVRISYDRAFREENLVQPFQQDFDLPVQVRAPWLDNLDGARLAKAGPADGVSLVLNGEEVGGLRGPPGGARGTVEIVRLLTPTRAGEFVLAAPSVRYVFGTRFREDFINGRTAIDRQDAEVFGAPQTLSVRELPEAGRPERFSGAVGQFSVEASADTATVAVGDRFTLTLRIAGSGNLDEFDTPRLELDGFHVYGAVDDRAIGAAARTITFDIAATRGGLAAVPAIVFSFFDPRAERYRAATTKPVRLAVTGVVDGPEAGREEAGSSDDGSALPPGLIAGVVAGIVAVLIVCARRRRRRADPEPSAAARFRERAAVDVEAAFAEFLAARLDCPPAAVVSPDLARRMERAGVARDLAARTAALVERLVAGRYGGTSSSESAKEANSLVEELAHSPPLRAPSE